MVLNASDSEGENALVPADTGHITPELRPDFFRDVLVPLFSPEDDVEVVFRDRVRLFCVAPKGAHYRNTWLSQALRPGLPLCRAFGPQQPKANG